MVLNYTPALAEGLDADPPSKGDMRAWLSQIKQACDTTIEQGRLLRNKGAGYPFTAKSRNGTISPMHDGFARFILDIRVDGAQPGKWYGITLFDNSAPDPASGWTINEYDASTFGSTSDEVRIMSTNQPSPRIYRSGAVQTVTLRPLFRPEVQFHVTVDASELPAQGTALSSANTAFPGWSWIIDPACYVYRPDASGSLSVAIDAATQSVSIQSAFGFSEDLRVQMNPLGRNGLFNIQRVEKAPRSSGPWATISDSGATDWFSPIVVRATSGQFNDSLARIYTGGSHGTDGASGGEATARTISWSAFADGRPIARSYSGPADEVRVTWINEIMAWNTTAVGRYVLRQYLTLVARAGTLEVWVEYVALEPVEVRTENGLQTVSLGYDSYLFYGAAAPARVSLFTETNSGPRSDAPDAWAVVLAHPTNGYLMTWMDRHYEEGDGKYVAPATPFIRRGTEDNRKIYHQVVGSMDAAIGTGGAIRYHGGYAWAPPSILTQNTADSAVVYRDRGAAKVAWAFLQPGTDRVQVGPLHAEKSIAGKTVGASGYLPISATSATFQTHSLI